MESVISLVAYLFLITQLHCFPVNCNPPDIGFNAWKLIVLTRKVSLTDRNDPCLMKSKDFSVRKTFVMKTVIIKAIIGSKTMDAH